MPRHMFPALLGLTVFPLVAVGIAAWMLVGGGAAMAGPAGAIMVLAAAVFAVAMVLLIKLSHHEAWAWDNQDQIRDLSERTEALTTRLGAVEEEVRQPGLKLDLIMADVKKLRDGFQSLAEREPATGPQPRIDFERKMPPSAAETEQAGADHLELLLEPVIELSTGSTMHYRAIMDLTDEQGHALRHAELMRKAEEGGMRAALDAHLVKLVTPVVRRLRGRNPGTRVFVPLGRSTLESLAESERIVTALSRETDVAGGLIFEIEFRDLGALDDTGIAMLARLARVGVTMSLANVQVHGLDLASLRQLGVRFLSLPPHAVDAGAGPSPAASEFLQYARAMHFQVVISNIVTPQQATAATKFGRFGYGAFFAPPRKVRADAGVTANARGISAA